MSAVLVLVEHDGRAADDLSRQAARLARGYAEAAGVELEAVLIGPGAAEAAAGLGELGVRRRTSPSTRVSPPTRRGPGGGRSPGWSAGWEPSPWSGRGASAQRR